jgi:photosystem II stability/assembly factor-like uncharacterized protein
MKSWIIAALFGLGQAQGASLLDTFNPTLRPNTPVPDWLSPLQGQSAQLDSIEAAYRKALFVKYGPSPALAAVTDEWSQGLEPWYRAYKSWKKEIRWAVKADGRIDLKDLDPQSHPVSTPTPASSQAFDGAAGGAGTWSAMGPFQVFWPVRDDLTQRACPWHINIYKVRMAPSNTSVVYALGETGHFYRTTDKGLNWTIPNPNYPTGVEALAVHPTDPNTVIVAGGNHLQRSTDGGSTWTIVHTVSGLGANEVWFDATGNIALASTAKGLFRSTNSGVSWSAINNNLCYDVAFNPLNSNSAYALCRSGSVLQFLKSSNGGVSFTAKTSGFDNTTANEGGVLGISPADTNKIYVTFLSNGASGIKMLRSVNSGESWSNGAGPSSNTNDLSSFINWQGFYNLGLAVSPTDANVVITGTANAHRSTDGAMTFPVTIGGFRTDVFPIHPDFQDIDTKGTDTWIATDGGLVYSSDFFGSEAKAEARSKGIPSHDFWHWDQGWDQDIHVGGRYHNGNIVMSENYPAGEGIRYGGAESATGWVLHGLANTVITDDAGNYQIPATKSGSMVSFDYRKYPGGDGYGSQSSELLIDPDLYTHHYVGNGNELWESWDGGLSFSSIKNFGGAMRKMDIARPDGNTLYVAVNGQTSLQRSTDGGKTWTGLLMPGGASGSNVDFATNPENAQEIWLIHRSGANGSKVWQSTDGGSTWTNRTTAALDGIEPWMVHYIGGNGAVYITARKSVSISGIGTRQSKVFYRASGASEWTDYSSGLPLASMEVNRSLPFYRDAKLRMSSNHGLWQTPLADQNIKPVAQPSLSKSTTDCARDSIELYDYSIAKGTKSRVWRVSPAPLAISDSTALRPKVLFGKIGKYSITLEVTDAANQKSTKTLTNAFEVTGNVCGVETSGGKSMQLSGSGQEGQIPASNLNTNRLTLTSWFKITQAQPAYTGLVLMRNSATNVGIIFKENNTLGFDWADKYWSRTNSTAIPLNQWNHVAFVAQPDSLKLYLNGSLIQSVAATISAQNFNSAWSLGVDPNVGDGRRMTGLIDEVQILSKSLSFNEILARKDKAAATGENGLLGYYQFNESSGTTVWDRVGTRHALLVGGASRANEGAPINGQIVSNEQNAFAPAKGLGAPIQAQILHQDQSRILQWSAPQGENMRVTLFEISGKKLAEHQGSATGTWALPASQGQARVLRMQTEKHLRFMVIAP